MNELDEMSCDEFDRVAAELALGVLTGRERAAALEHLDRCEACRIHVRQLTMTGEELVGLLPAIEPPPGFETRVLDRLGIAATSDPGPAGSELSSAALLTASHQAVGKIFLYDGNPRWVYMSVYMEMARGAVTCQLIGRNGHVTTVGTFRLAGGYGAWGSADPVDNGPLTGARLVDSAGTVLALASFASPIG